MRNYTFRDHLIGETATFTTALEQLSVLAEDAILFLINNEGNLIGSLTDGDVRRGLLRGLNLNNKIGEFVQPNPKFVIKGQSDIYEIIKLRESKFKILPVLDRDNKVINVINFRYFNSYLPIDAVIMAGGRGSRLSPLTDNIPKPLLKIGNKSIIEYNIDRLISFGIVDFWISVNYLGEQIQEHLNKGYKNLKTFYVSEKEPFGTIGAVSSINNFENDFVLVTNSDILTNLDYEDFFLTFLKSGADMSIVTIPYSVNIPYAVLEMKDSQVLSLKEKPTYTYYSNGGIYLIKKDVLKHIPKNQFFNATDLIELLITLNYNIHSYPLRNYWLDIGKHEDFEKAQEDIKHIKF